MTVRIATYERGELVARRALASALAQTYRRLEVLVVGDHCDPATAEAVLSVRDPRVRFVNLSERGRYPDDPRLRWMVAGAAPMNAALWLAQGKWIAPCDDDDELSPDHVEVLLDQARRRRLELVWSKASMELEPGRWVEAGSERLRLGSITHGSVLYSAHLRFFAHSLTSWRLGQPSDWNLWSRMRRAGVRMGFVDRLTYVHYLEATRRPLDTGAA
ncbi:MAG TPA: glycosyltransferase family A protein, partial [Acidimicrobiales bacterium]|nr:glycosyltransferase family A protein [Acidimicrobiales bacterium]